MNLLQIVNTPEGKEVLSILGQKPEYKIVDITKDSFTEHIEEDIYQSTFFSGNVVAKLFEPILSKMTLAKEAGYVENKTEALLHYAGLSPKNSKYPQIFLSSTFNPVAGANDPCDGRTVCSIAQPGQAFAAFLTNAASSASATDSTGNACMLQSASTGSGWVAVERSIYNFSTGSLTSQATILDAVISFWVISKGNAFGSVPVMRIVTATPASNANVITADHSQYGTAQVGSFIIDNLVTSAYNDWINNNLNANISKTTDTAFGARVDWDANGVFAGVYTNGGQVFANINFADVGSNAPKLVVTFTRPGGAFLYNI